MATVVVIKNGPSKFDLMSSLFDHLPERPRPVGFTLEGNGQVPVWFNISLQLVITLIQREDGSGNSWIFEGQAGSDRYRGHFRTDSRKGRIEKIER